MIRIEKHVGVYYRESSENKTYHGKVDRCFYITFRQGGKKVWEKVGWLSEGYSAQVAAGIRGERIRAMRHGEELPKKRKRSITFGEAWDYYNRWLDTGKKHPADDRNRYKNHLRKKFAEKPLSQITLLDLEDLKSELLKNHLATATVKHVLALVRQIINKAIKWNLWEGSNPIKGIDMPKLNNKRVRFLSPAEATNILDELKKVSTTLYEISLLSLHTGMRAGEVFTLKREHLDFDNNLIHVANPKGVEARKVFMTETVKTMLQEKSSLKPGELVFKSRKWEKIKEVSRAFSRLIKTLKYNDGITDPRQRVYFHTLRHTFASWLAIKGKPILTIKELLGHKSLAMTERYAHLIPDTKRDAIKAIEDMLPQTDSEKDRDHVD